MKQRIGIAGESECGKSTLAKAVSKQFWERFGTPTLVYDPWRDAWGRQAWVTTSEENFRAAVEKRKDCLVIIEDASMTIQRDKEFTPFFTAIRHQGHHLLVICHDATDLLRPMRRNLNQLYLFTQTEDAIELWKASQPSMLGMEQAVNLKQYEFLKCVKFATQEPQPMRLKL